MICSASDTGRSYRKRFVWMTLSSCLLVSLLFACHSTPPTEEVNQVSVSLSLAPPPATHPACQGCRARVAFAFTCDYKSVWLGSCKNITDVMLQFSDKTRQIFRNLQGKTGTFKGTGAHAGKTLLGVWVKSGCNVTGYGLYCQNRRRPSECIPVKPPPPPPPPQACSKGKISAKYASLSKDHQKCVGKPICPERKTKTKKGCYRHYDTASIYWSAQTGAFEIHGAIRKKWSTMGAINGFLGFPISDELKIGAGPAAYQKFEHGRIYWSPKSGAHEVHGGVLGKWLSMGAENSCLGYPTSDEKKAGKGRKQYFENGTITWTASTGAVAKCNKQP